MNNKDIGEVVGLLKAAVLDGGLPIVSQLAADNYDPYALLVSTLISLRTKDEVTAVATERLLKLAESPGEMVKLSEEDIGNAIYPAGFYRNKARTIREISQTLLEKYDGSVPDTMEALLTLKGVGRKTANLVISLGFDKDGICVDTHVHRISNRMGYVKTKTPDQTEAALRDKLPNKFWKIYNTLMVAFGRQICRPLSPRCSSCPVHRLCDRSGVTKSR